MSYFGILDENIGFVMYRTVLWLDDGELQIFSITQRLKQAN